MALVHPHLPNRRSMSPMKLSKSSYRSKRTGSSAVLAALAPKCTHSVISPIELNCLKTVHTNLRLQWTKGTKIEERMDPEYQLCEAKLNLFRAPLFKEFGSSTPPPSSRGSVTIFHTRSRRHLSMNVSQYRNAAASAPNRTNTVRISRAPVNMSVMAVRIAPVLGVKKREDENLDDKATKWSDSELQPVLTLAERLEKGKPIHRIESTQKDENTQRKVFFDDVKCYTPGIDEVVEAVCHQPNLTMGSEYQFSGLYPDVLNEVFTKAVVPNRYLCRIIRQVGKGILFKKSSDQLDIKPQIASQETMRTRKSVISQPICDMSMQSANYDEFCCANRNQLGDEDLSFYHSLGTVTCSVMEEICRDAHQHRYTFYWQYYRTFFRRIRDEAGTPEWGAQFLQRNPPNELTHLLKKMTTLLTDSVENPLSDARIRMAQIFYHSRSYPPLLDELSRRTPLWLDSLLRNMASPSLSICEEACATLCVLFQNSILMKHVAYNRYFDILFDAVYFMITVADITPATPHYYPIFTCIGVLIQEYPFISTLDAVISRCPKCTNKVFLAKFPILLHCAMKYWPDSCLSYTDVTVVHVRNILEEAYLNPASRCAARRALHSMAYRYPNTPPSLVTSINVRPQARSKPICIPSNVNGNNILT